MGGGNDKSRRGLIKMAFIRINVRRGRRDGERGGDDDDEREELLLYEDYSSTEEEESEENEGKGTENINN